MPRQIVTESMFGNLPIELRHKADTRDQKIPYKDTLFNIEHNKDHSVVEVSNLNKKIGFENKSDQSRAENISKMLCAYERNSLFLKLAGYVTVKFSLDNDQSEFFWILVADQIQEKGNIYISDCSELGEIHLEEGYEIAYVLSGLNRAEEWAKVVRCKIGDRKRSKILDSKNITDAINYLVKLVSDS